MGKHDEQKKRKRALLTKRFLDGCYRVTKAFIIDKKDSGKLPQFHEELRPMIDLSLEEFSRHKPTNRIQELLVKYD